MASSSLLLVRNSFAYGKNIVRVISINTACLRNYSQETKQSSSVEKMSFEEYRKLRKALKLRGRIAGIPLGMLAITVTSSISVNLMPDMFNPQPEVEIQPIL